MNNNYLTSINKTIFGFIIISIIGFSLRIVLSEYGYMYDAIGNKMNVDVYKFNGNIFDSGRYNYSPLGWINITYLLDKIPFFNLNDFDSFRIKVTIFLGIIDLILFTILFRLYSLKIASLFFLNPISIYVSGFHQQFGNVAILVCFIAVLLYEKYKNNFGFYICAFLVGISLCIKHIMIFFPLWIAIKEKTWSKKILILLIPIFIFIFSFISYFNDDSFYKIYSHVFTYVSFNNYPFWSVFTPQFLYNYIGAKNLFFGTMILMGFFFENKNIRDSFFFYLICLVTFSSGVANQYLAIPLIGLAVFWNRYYFLFTIFAILFFLVDIYAFNIDYFQDLINWSTRKDRIAYKIIIFFLAIGLLENIIGGKKINLFIKNIITWIVKKFKSQIFIK